MSKQQLQHIVPRVYLKYFSTDSFVYVINFADKYKSDQIQKVGISHKVFKENKYYDFGKSSLEAHFSKFENHYVELINGLESRLTINISAKRTMISWMHMSKMRSDFFRSIASSVFKNADEEKGHLAGKLFQLMAFYGADFEKSLDDFVYHFFRCEWKIFVACDDLQFITNDNPGLAYSDYYRFKLLNMSPVFGDFNFNKEHSAIHFFPLTSKMCLCLTPCKLNDPTLDEMESVMLKEIQFETATPKLVEEINMMVYMTRHKMVVANREKEIISYLKR